MKKQPTDEEILALYKAAFKKYNENGVVNVDKQLRHKLDFAVQRLEDVLRALDNVVPPNRQSVYYVTFFKQGKAEKTVGAYQFPLVDDTLFVVPQNVIHSTLYATKACSGYILNFNIQFFLDKAFPSYLIQNKQIFKAIIQPYVVVNATQREELATIFETIIRENHSDEIEKHTMIALKILELLILCDRYFMEANLGGQSSGYNATVAAFGELVDQHFTSRHAVRFYADALHMNADQLTVLTKKFLGLSAKEVIDRRIVLEAKSLLASTSASVKEIAFELGFSDANYFSSFFQRRADCSPVQYRDNQG